MSIKFLLKQSIIRSFKNIPIQSHLFENYFEYFLYKMVQQYARTLINNYRMSISVGYFYQIVGTIFFGCCSDQHGGSIYLNHISINCTVFHCSFVACCCTGSTSNGGGIAVEKSNDFVISSSCFTCCKAYRCPGFIIWGHKGYITQVINSDCNMSSEYNPDLIGAGSVICSFNRVKYFCNNVSHSFTNDVNAGIIFGAETESICCQFVTLSHCIGNGVIGNSVFTPNIRNTIANLNFISCIVTNGYGIIFITWTNTVIFEEVVFSNCSFQKIVSGSTTGSVEFRNCHFESNNSGASFSNAITIGCSFGDPTLNHHYFLNTKSCHTASSYLKDSFTNYLPYMCSISVSSFIFLV